jgi:hypothetical protein
MTIAELIMSVIRFFFDDFFHFFELVVMVLIVKGSFGKFFGKTLNFSKKINKKYKEKTIKLTKPDFLKRDGKTEEYLQK